MRLRKEEILFYFYFTSNGCKILSKRLSVVFFLFSTLLYSYSFGQVTIFSENMGVPGGATTIAAYSTGIAPATFQNSPALTFTGTADVRPTNASAGYTGASGGGNVFITSTAGTFFQISNINTQLYNTLSLSFGIYKPNTTGTGSDLIVEVSSDGVSFTPLSYTALPTGTGTATWYLRTATGTIPSTSNLRIQFRQTGAVTQYRIDDVVLTGFFNAISSIQSGNWSSSSTWQGGSIPSSSQNVIITAGTNVTVDNATYSTRNAGTVTIVNGTLAATGLTYTNNGSTTVNGSFQLNQGSWATGTNFTYGAAGTLIFNNTTGSYGVNNDVFWPATSGPPNVTVAGAGGLTMNVSRTVSGTFQTAAGVTLSSVTLTINGTCQLNTGGYFNQSPTYGASSLLKYNTGGTYGRANEWRVGLASPVIGTTTGYPNDVQLSNNTTLDVPFTTAGLFNQTVSLARDLTIDAGSSLYMDYGGGSNKSGALLVGRNVVLNGNLSLGNASGGDMNVGGSWTRIGVFTPNSRAVTFNGSAVQNITGSTTFDYLTVNNSSGISLQASTDITVNNTLNLTTGKIITGVNKTIIPSTGTINRTAGWVNGNLQKYLTAGAAVQRVFEVGGSNNYLPDTIWANVDVAGSVVVGCFDGAHPNLSTSQLSTTKSINRYWNFANAGAGISSYDASFNYLAADKPAGSAAIMFQASYFNSPDWVLYSAISVDSTNNYFKLTGSTLNGNIAVGESKTYNYFRSRQSGSWTSDTTWSVSNDNVTWVNAPVGFIPDAISTSVIVQSGHTVSKTDKNPRSIKNLTVVAGGSLIAGSSVGQLTYITLYGNILCNGNIGTGTSDSISFNIDGVNDTISGTGTFKCQRMRKNFVSNLQTNLVVYMNVITGFGGVTTTSFYNNAGTSIFNVTVKSGVTLTASSVSIDGTRGTGSGRNSGTYSIYGTLNISDTLFATTDNGSYPCNITIYNGGLINTKLLKCSSSGAARHTLSIQNGGRLNITGAAGFFQFSNTNNVYDFQPGSTVEYAATVNQTIEAAIPYYDNLTLSGSGSKIPNGDLNIRGNWTRTFPALFDPANRYVFFNGISGNQIVKVSGASTESFAYLVIDKPATQSLQLSASPATDINVYGAFGGYTFQLKGGNLDLNGRVFNFAMSSNGNNNNIAVDGSAGNLVRNINSSLAGGIFKIYNIDNLARFSMIRQLGANAATLSVNDNVTLTIGGSSQNSGVDFGNSLTTINNIFQINTWGYVEANPPTYGSNSTLIYNSGGAYKRYLEWSTLFGPGYPNHVTVQNNTALRINDDNIPVNNNGNGTADRAMAGTFTISTGSSAVLGDSTENNKLTIGKDFILNGTITMPSSLAAIGADLYIAGNWNRSSTGVFNHNERAVFFNGSSRSTITASGGQYFPYLYLQKNATTDSLKLLDNITIGKIFTINSGTFDLAAKDVILRSRDTTAQFGPIGTNGRVSYSGVGRFIVERYASARRAWRLLSSPTRHDVQTIKQAWQENALIPNSNPVPGFGTQITSNRSTWQTDGFDTLSNAGPSVKWYNPASSLYEGIASTNSSFIIGRAYMTFIRGDRSVTQFAQAPTTTILREKGSLLIGDTTFQIGTADTQFVSVGNPYASAIDFTKLTRTNVQPYYYLWDPVLSTYGAYQTCLISGTTIVGAPGGGSYASGNFNIQSGQGFFVRNTMGIGNLTFKEIAKAPGSMQFNRGPDNFGSLRTNLYRIQNSSPILTDGTLNVFDTSFTNGLDMMDAIKLTNTNENLSIRNAGKYFAIESRQGISMSDTIQFSLEQARVANYRFEFIPQLLTMYNAQAYLEDRYLNTRIPLSMTDTTSVDFSITSVPDSYRSDRFRIVFTSLRPLPVTMYSLTAARNKTGGVSVTWKSDNESGIRTYKVERSMDGRQFQEVGQESPLSNNGGTGIYNHQDVDAPSAMVYYRVAAIGIDGTIQYTNVAKLNAIPENPSIAVTPNPVSGNVISIDFRNMEEGEYNAILFNMEGKRVSETSFLVAGNYENKKMRLGKELSSGQYNLVIYKYGQQRYTLLVQIIR